MFASSGHAPDVRVIVFCEISPPDQSLSSLIPIRRAFLMMFCVIVALRLAHRPNTLLQVRAMPVSPAPMIVLPVSVGLVVPYTAMP
jgi:hypothetical protein